MLTFRRARLAFMIAAALARAVPFWSLADAAVFLATGFFAGAFWAGFLAGAFFAAGLPSFPLAAGFLSPVFFAAGFLSVAFLAGAFFSAGFLAAAAGFFSAGLAAFFSTAGLLSVAAGRFAAGFLSLSDSPAKIQNFFLEFLRLDENILRNLIPSSAFLTIIMSMNWNSFC